MRILISKAILLLLALPLWAQSGSITGTVYDADTGETLPGAHVTVEGTTRGAVTDMEGRYTFTGLAPGEYKVLISYTGYQNAELTVTVVADEAAQADVELQPGIELDPVQITAGRQQEKVLDAPASISVVGSSEIELEAPQTAVRALRNVAGLDIVQSGVDRHEVVLRGFNNAFSSAAYVMTDYRQAGAAVIGVNLHSIMPSQPIDLERVEIVRGPGAALYGPGVDSGVIHYITKDAFSYPGATVAVTGGERSLMNFQGRIARVIGSKLGLKLVGSFGQANDFELESCDANLVQQQQFSECPDPLDAQQLYLDGPRDNRFRKGGLAGYAEYRFSNRTSLLVNAGFAQLSTTVLSGIGTIQGVGYRSSFGQIRFNSGPFFAQGYVNKNHSGDSYVYNGDPLIELSSQANIQAQYDMHIGGEREELIIGVDLEFLSPNSDGTVYGRNEDSDNVQELGAYVQSETRISNTLDLVVALRGDYHSVFEKVRFSPRAGLVYKPSLTSSFRLTYNSTHVNPSATSLFLDLIAAKLPMGPDAFLNVRGRGGVHGYTWNRNAAYLGVGAPTDLVATSLLPGMEGADMPVGLPTDLVYNFMYQGIAAIPNDDLADMLVEALGLNPDLAPLLAGSIGTIKALLHPDETQVQGFSRGGLGTLNLSTQEIDPIPLELAPLPRIKPQRSLTYEAGYKGIIGSRVLLAVDAYYTERENFVGALQMKTPFVLVPSLAQDLTRDLANGIANNDALVALMDVLGAIAGLDLTPEAAAALLVSLAESDLPSPKTPVGVVQPAENHAGAGNLPELLITYPNFGHVSLFGADAAVNVLASDALSLFANMSWVSDDFFDHTETGEEDSTAVLALNAPGLKVKLGGAYRFGNGLSIISSGRYVKGFSMVSGQYIGDVESYFLMDLGVGYRITGGLRADLSVANVTNNVHREFIGAPKVGRVATLRLLYTVRR